MFVAKLQSMFAENLGLKIVSLTLALLLELYFYSPDNSISEVLPARISFENLPAQMVIVDPPNSKSGIDAEIEVRGPRQLVEQLRSGVNQVSVKAPIALLPGSFPLRVDSTDVSVPSGVEVLKIVPRSTSVTVETRAGKELIVVVQSVGEVADGFILEGINVFPDTVVVRGALSKLESLAAVETLAVDVDGKSKSFRQEVSLKPQELGVEIGVTLVTADVKIKPKRVKKTLSDVRIDLLAPKGFAATLGGSPKANVILSGPSSVLDRLSSTQFRLKADASSKGEGVHSVELGGDLPDDVLIESITPQEVSVTIRGTNGETVRD